MNSESENQSIRPRRHRTAFYKVPNFPSVEASVESLMEELGIDKPFRDTLAKLLRLLTINYTDHMSYENASTQTPLEWQWESNTVEPGDERGNDGNDETQPKVLSGECSVKHTENTEQESPYDNAHCNTQYGNYSLQIQERRETEQRRRQSACEFNIATFNERECLANAIQFNITDLVDGVVFKESELPDCLLSEGCLTEDECSSLRKHRDRKDQIRILVSLINGRDLRVLKGFLKYIKHHNRDVAEKITKTFEQNKHRCLGQKTCFLCQLKNNFNIKHLADSLWSIQVIDKGTYNTIIFSDLPVGAQGTLWSTVIHSLNYLNKQQAETAHQRLLDALSRNGLFTYLADGIQSMLIKNHGRLTCSCEQRLVIQRRDFSSTVSSSGESFYPKSSSDGTANDIGSTCRTNDRTYAKTLYNRSDSMAHNLSEDNPLFPTSLFKSSDNYHDVGNSIPESIPEENLL